MSSGYINLKANVYNLKMA